MNTYYTWIEDTAVLFGNILFAVVVLALRRRLQGRGKASAYVVLKHMSEGEFTALWVLCFGLTSFVCTSEWRRPTYPLERHDEIVSIVCIATRAGLVVLALLHALLNVNRRLPVTAVATCFGIVELFVQFAYQSSATFAWVPLVARCLLVAMWMSTIMLDTSALFKCAPQHSCMCHCRPGAACPSNGWVRLFLCTVAWGTQDPPAAIRVPSVLFPDEPMPPPPPHLNIAAAPPRPGVVDSDDDTDANSSDDGLDPSISRHHPDWKGATAGQAPTAVAAIHIAIGGGGGGAAPPPMAHNQHPNPAADDMLPSEHKVGTESEDAYDRADRIDILNNDIGLSLEDAANAYADRWRESRPSAAFS